MTNWELLNLLEPCCYMTFIGLRILMLLGICLAGFLVTSLLKFVHKLLSSTVPISVVTSGTDS